VAPIKWIYSDELATQRNISSEMKHHGTRKRGGEERGRAERERNKDRQIKHANFGKNAKVRCRWCRWK
jgi:hypothetical protein